MITFDIGQVRREASERLSQAPHSPKKLALLYAGVAVGANLLITVLDLLLLRSIGSTGGLSGLGTRSVIETIRTLLRYAITLALPFWSFGFVHTAILMARGGDNHPQNLLEGFRRFGPALRLQLIQLGLYFAVAMVSINVGSMLFYMTPMASDMLALVEPMLTEGATMEQIQEAMLQIPTQQMVGAMWPALAIGAVVCLALLIPLCYKLRLAGFFVMDEPRMGAVMAMLVSAQYMRKNRLKWFRMELRFWWYYCAMALTWLVIYGDALLPLVGVSMPMDSDAAWLLFYVLGALLQFILDWQAFGKIQTTYAVAYDILRQQPLPTPEARPTPRRFPWDEYPAEEENP